MHCAKLFEWAILYYSSTPVDWADHVDSLVTIQTCIIKVELNNLYVNRNDPYNMIMKQNIHLSKSCVAIQSITALVEKSL